MINKVLESNKYLTIDLQDNEVDPVKCAEFRITLEPLHELNKKIVFE
jgi:hypothetical protein